MKESLVRQKAMLFSIKSVELYKVLLGANEYLLLGANEYLLPKQFIKSATDIGANINEALAGCSKKDFAAKMSISSKEARESKYWLELLENTNFVNFDYSELNKMNDELVKMLTSIVKTSQLNLKTKNN